MTLQEYLKKYGYKGLGLLVGEYIRRAPAFPGDQQLAKEVGSVIADLESALEDGQGLITFIRTSR